MHTTLITIFVLLIEITLSLLSANAASQSVGVSSGVPVSVNYQRVNLPECTTGIVETKDGPVCGKIVSTVKGEKVSAYLGIPFAEPPTVENRWRSPQPVKPWKGVFKATEFGPSCPQNSSQSPQSEDCLTINVWAPEGDSKEPGAVMVFIHGGAFLYGASADALYDGAYKAARGGVVVVSFNYRLGALGFLAGIKDNATREEINGNFGFQDQILALKWVKDNISAFGGDPAKVTVYGESAGAMSIGLHLVSSPESEGLFRAAIMESNALGVPYKTLEDSRSISKKFTHDLGCPNDDIKCVRDKLPEVILDTQGQRNLIWPAVLHGIMDLLVWAPVIDGRVVSDQPIKAISQGKTGVPIIIGTNRDEGLLFIELTKKALGKKSFSAIDYRVMVDFMIRDHEIRKKIYRIYPPVEGDNTQVIAKVITDYVFVCPSRYTAKNFSPKTWSYAFNHVSSFNIWPKTPACAAAVCHASELPFVFHTPRARGYEFKPNEAELSDFMIDSWTGFAKDLTPVSDTKIWPPFSTGSESLVFTAPHNETKTTRAQDANCALWDETGYDLHESFWGIL